MSTWLDPVGPHSRAVYWRRRVVSAGVLLLVVFLVSRACGSDRPPDLGIKAGATQTPVPLVSTYTPTATPTPTSTATGTTAPTRTGAGVASDAPAGAGARGPVTTATRTREAAPTGCARDDVEVQVAADARRYAAKTNPRLLISVANRGDTACTFDVGSKALTLVVSSGKDRIWSSDDCQRGGTSDVRLLKPGKPFVAAAVWSRVRSAPGCPKGQPTAGPGTYLLSGSANGIAQQRRAVFQLD